MNLVAQSIKHDSIDSTWESERIVSDAIGRLIEFWGFRRNMGRIWTLLYLSVRPLTAKELRERLQLSSGAISMTLAEMGRWGVVQKEWIQGSRCDYFSAEKNLWKMISHVLRERERVQLQEAIEAFEKALRSLDQMNPSNMDRTRVQIQRERIRRLLEMGRLLRTILDAVLTSSRLETSWLSRIKLPRRSWLS